MKSSELKELFSFGTGNLNDNLNFLPMHCDLMFHYMVMNYFSNNTAYFFLAELRIIRHIFAVFYKHYHAHTHSYNYSTYIKSSKNVDTVKMACIKRKHIKIISRNILSGNLSLN